MFEFGPSKINGCQCWKVFGFAANIIIEMNMQYNLIIWNFSWEFNFYFVAKYLSRISNDIYVIIRMHFQNFSHIGPAVWPVHCLSVCQSDNHGILNREKDWK
jgi:hypothetical protein